MKFNKKCLYVGVFSVILLQSTQVISTVFTADNINNNQNNNEILSNKLEDETAQKDNDEAYAKVNHGHVKDVTDFSDEYRLGAVNGRIVNFYVENEGEQPIRIHISGGNYKTINKGGKGYVSTTLRSNNFQEVRVTAEPLYGGKISFYYSIAQRN